MSELTDDEREQYLRIPLEAARRDVGRLAPVVGAGLSVPLGAPTWSSLIGRLCAASGVEQRPGDRPGELFGRFRQSLGASAYETLVQQGLSASDQQTSLAHQAIVGANVRHVFTTNLDYALERSFELAGRALRPENVIVGSQPNAERLLRGAARTGVVLVKVHGTLHDPDSWVLEQRAYDEGYLTDGRLSKLWGVLELRPLFIGFGFADDDVNESLRSVEMAYRRGGYAIMSITAIRQNLPALRRSGVMPIAVLDFAQVPEVIDEIFRCSPLTVERRVEVGTSNRTVIVGATSVAAPADLDDDAEFEVVTAVANAVEVQPYASFLRDEPRRRYGQRGQYFNSLLQWAAVREDAKITAVLDALTRYPDVFVGQLLPRALRQQKPADILTVMYTAADERAREAIRNAVLETLDNPVDTGYVTLRSLAWFAASVRAHPGMAMPPTTVSVNSPLAVTKYPLTRYQIGMLRRDASLCESHPIRPYTLKSQHEIDEIVRLLNEQFGAQGRWRLPTADEWLGFSATGVGRWPWGDADPERGRHAHLRYVAGGAIAAHPLEVGVFPGDRSPVRDLIGNVYEVVLGDMLYGDPSLAGGSWTTSFKDSTTSRFGLISNWTGRFRDNVGLRPVRESGPTG